MEQAMNLQEVADYLKVSKEGIYNAIRKGNKDYSFISKVGGSYRVLPGVLDKWIAKQLSAFLVIMLFCVPCLAKEVPANHYAEIEVKPIPLFKSGKERRKDGIVIEQAWEMGDKKSKNWDKLKYRRQDTD